MSFLNQTFNINELPEDEGSYELLAPGWYDVIINDADLCTTNAGTGQYIKLKLMTAQGRIVFSNLNIHNPSERAQQIGLGQLRSIMAATNLQTVQNTDQLIGGRLQVKVAIREARDCYEAQNEVKAYKARAVAATPAPTQNYQAQKESYKPAPQQASPVEDDDIPF